MFTFTRKQNVYTSALAVGLAIAFVALSASAASTISTNITTNGTLTVDGASTLTGNVTAGADLTVTSGARVGTGSTGTNITALADDSLFVEGAVEVDGITWGDGGVVANASSTVNSTLTVSGIFQASSTVLIGGTGTSTTAGNFDAAADIEADQLYTSGTGTSTFSGGLKLVTGGLTLSTINCTVYASGGALTTDSSGNVYCTDDSTSDGWTDDGIVLRLATVGDHVAMATTTEADVRSVATLTATSTAGSILTLKTRAVSSGLDYSGSALVITNSASTTLFSIDGKGRIAGFVSSASSTIDAALTVSGAFQASSTAYITGVLNSVGGFISNASSTVGSTLNVSGVFQASSTALVNGLLTAVGGLVSNASSTIGSTLNVSGVFQASSTALVNGLRVDTGTLGVATSTPGQEVGIVGDVLVSSAATTTITLGSTDAESGGCIQLRGTDALWYRMYIVSTTTPSNPTRGLVVEQGICQTP